MSNWFYKNEIFLSENIGDKIGFVYVITDLVENKKYIGKKKFKATKRLPPLKGKKRKRTVVSESDWKEYFGSSEEVKALVENTPPERWRREILRLCKTTAEMSYYEMKYQVLNDALLKPEEYYNGFVGGKIHRSHLKHLTDESAENFII